MYKSLLIIATAFALTACSGSVKQYQSNLPKFVPEQFFSGQLCAWGTVRDYSSSVSRRFVADIKADSAAGKFSLDEVFLFDDGERQTRLWQFTQRSTGWQGTAGDVVGIAEGEFVGNMMQLTYDLEINQDGDTLIIAMDDALHLIDNNVLMGKTIMKKFGITVGEIDLVMTKETDNSRCNLENDTNE